MTGKTPMWRRYLTFWGRDIDRDLRDEVEFHIAARTRELVDAGWPPDAAAAEARRQFGNRDAIVSECHQIDIALEKKKRMTRHLNDLQGDIHFAVRQFFSPAPVFGCRGHHIGARNRIHHCHLQHRQCRTAGAAPVQ